MPNFTDTAPIVDLACPFGCTSGERHRVVDTVWEAPNSAVYRCSACGIVFIDPIMSVEEERSFYEAEFAAYMKDRGGPGETDPADHFRSNEGEAARRLANLQPHLRPGMRVLELGSSSGSLLATIAPHVGSVQGVEPGSLYRDYANGRGIPTVPELGDLAGQGFDALLAYYVVEHLREPVATLQEWRSYLAPGGLIAIEVPNVEDALVRYYQLDAFDRFYWQKAHYFNYSHQTLRLVLERAGYGRVVAVPEQRYDISNHVHWLWQGKPGGKGRYTDLFDDRVNAEYARCLKERWLCDTVFMLAWNEA